MPFAAVLFPQFKYFKLFVCGPLVSAHIRIYHIDPPFAALSWLSMAARSNSPIEFLCDAGPLFRLTCRATILLHALGGDFFGNFAQNFSFSSRPSRLLSLDILYEQPSLLALTGGATWY